MSKHKRITVDIGELAWAFGDLDHRYYLDLETGELLSNVGGEDPEELEARVEAELGTRYLAVPTSEPAEGYQDLVDFIDGVADPTLRATLTMAIQGAEAFGLLKEMLVTYPEERKRWFAFRDARIKERLEEWLEGEGVRVEWEGRI